jgi:diguanylate cyclase (GGDEF)-like protein
MVALVLLLGGFNMALGFGLAVGLEQFPRLRRKWKRRHAAPVEPQKVVVKKIVKKKREAPVAPAPLSVDELPAEWFGALAEEAVVATSFVEASVQVLRLEVGKYRQKLVEVDTELRALGETPPPEQLADLTRRIDEINRDWLSKQAEAASHLSSKRGNLGSFETVGKDLEQTLLEQAAQIETTCSNVQSLDMASPDAPKKMAREMVRLIDLAHALRDLMSEALLSITVAENKLSTLERKFQIDPLTAMPNRFGLETLLRDWWHSDPSRQRMVSCVLVDLDRTGKLNEQFGARRVDWMIAGIGRWLEDQLRRDRGCDRIARYDGQSFLLFLGDTGPRNATSAAERIRQTLDVTTFEIGQESFEATATFAVVEIEKRDSSERLWERLSSTLQFARKTSRNCTALEENGRASPVTPPQFQVKARVVRLADE